MYTLGPRAFHMVMGGLMLGSIVVENSLPDVVPSWRAPDVGLLTLVVGLVWVGRYSAWRTELDSERQRVLEDRLERLERTQRMLEDELREHLRRPL